MNDQMYLSYSGRKCYQECPKKYEYKYILKDPSKSDPRDSIFGSTIGKIFEWFYDRDLWKLPNVENHLISLIDPAIKHVCQESKFDISSHPSFKDQLKTNLKTYIPHGLNTIKANKLVGKRNYVEQDLTVVYSYGSGLQVKLVGRSDFTVHTIDDQVYIIDGKASKYRDKYVDSQQLIWYATLHYLKFGVAPSQIGFLFYMFPDSPISWIQYKSDDMRSCIQETGNILVSIKKSDFPARPTKNCNMCLYKAKCSEAISFLKDQRQEVNPQVTSSVFLIEEA